MIRLQRSLAFVFVLLVWAGSALAYPPFLEDFRKDPFRRSGAPNMDSCSVCHINPQGGGERNTFGQAFESGGERITPMLRAQFPDRFAYPVSRTGDTLVIHFSDPENKQVVVETAGTKAVIDVASKTLNGAPAAAGTAAAPPAPPATGSAVSRGEKRSEVPVDPYAREGAFFGMQIVNLPNGKPMRGRGSVDFLIGHRFAQPISDAGANGLLGFDSFATVAFGARVGLTDRLSVGAARSNLDKTVELSFMFHVLRQGGKKPVTFAVRGGSEGRRLRTADLSRNQFRERYSPFIQPVLVHTIADRVSFEIAPTFAFNTRNEDSFSSLFGADHNNTIGLGIGTGVRLLPTTSLVGEYIPRVYGFKGEIRDRPGVSIGLQKSTYRHTFELVVSRQEPMTTAQYAVQGTDTFRIGFNIFRRIR